MLYVSNNIKDDYFYYKNKNRKIYYTEDNKEDFYPIDCLLNCLKGTFNKSENVNKFIDLTNKVYPEIEQSILKLENQEQRIFISTAYLELSFIEYLNGKKNITSKKISKLLKSGAEKILTSKLGYKKVKVK